MAGNNKRINDTGSGQTFHGRIYNNIVETIGNTPLIRIERMAREDGGVSFLVRPAAGDEKYTVLAQNQGLHSYEPDR